MIHCSFPVKLIYLLAVAFRFVHIYQSVYLGPKKKIEGKALAGLLEVYFNIEV